MISTQTDDERNIHTNFFSRSGRQKKNENGAEIASPGKFVWVTLFFFPTHCAAGAHWARVQSAIAVASTWRNVDSCRYMSCCQTDLMKKQSQTPIMLPLSTSPNSIMLACVKASFNTTPEKIAFKRPSSQPSSTIPRKRSTKNTYMQ